MKLENNIPRNFLAYNQRPAFLEAFQPISITPVNIISQAATLNEVYTVPAGRKAVVSFLLYNNSGSTSGNYVGVTRGSDTIQFTTSANLSNGNSTSIFKTFVYEAGDKIVLYTANAGVSIRALIYLYSDSLPVSTIVTAINDNVNPNVIYTAPSNKRVFIIPDDNGVGSLNSSRFYTSNGSGVSSNMSLYCLPVNESIDNAWLLWTTLAQGNLTAFTWFCPIWLDEGESIQAVVSDATEGKFGIITVQEFNK